MKRKAIGIAIVALAIGFNVPFALLAAKFNYPDILRRPVAEVLTAFAAGGPELVWIWYSFAISAIAMIPVAIAVGFGNDGWQARPGVAIGGAIVGTLAGMAQAIGLLRWVFAVPPLALAYTDPSATDVQRAAIEMGFSLMNLWGGVAIGEHLGQILTILWIGFVAMGQLADARLIDKIAAGFAGLGMVGIAIGLGDGLAVALNAPNDMFSLFTVGGYLAFSVWLIVTGIGFLTLRARQAQGYLA